MPRPILSSRRCERKLWNVSCNTMKNKKKGLFIVFEGLDGSGQGTQMALLERYLRSKKEKTYITSEPSHNLIGGLIRSLLRAHWKMSNTGIQLLYCADRAHHLEAEIEPVVAKGCHVICGRYRFSTMAFGSINNDVKWLERLNEKFPDPDVTIFLDVPPKECLRRIHVGRPLSELFETEKKLKKVYATYKKLLQDAKYKNVHSVNGSRPADEDAKDIAEIIEKYV